MDAMAASMLGARAPNVTDMSGGGHGGAPGALGAQFCCLPPPMRFSLDAPCTMCCVGGRARGIRVCPPSVPCGSTINHFRSEMRTLLRAGCLPLLAAGLMYLRRR
jgi:hypothetical protein